MFYSIELIAAFLFFAGLVVVYNLREIIENDNRVGYRYITTGLLTLVFSSALSVLGQKTILEPFSLYNYTVLIQLFYWIGMITGMTLLLSGISNWMPVYRKNLAYNQQAFLKVELFKKIEQLIRFEHRNNVILFQSIEMILKHYEYDEVGCFLYSQQNKEMSFLGAINEDAQSTLHTQSIHFNNQEIESSIVDDNIKLTYTTQESNLSPDLMLPMVADGKLLGAFCFYTDTPISDGVLVNLKLVLDILATQIIKTSKLLKAKAMSRELEWHKSLHNKFDLTKAVDGNISTLKTLLQSEMSVDYVAVAFSYKNKFPKISLSENNQVLQNFANEFRSQEDVEKYVSTMNTPVIINNLDVETDFDVDIATLQNDMKSMIVYPIQSSRGESGVLIIASSQYNAYTNKSLIYCKHLHNCLATTIANSINLLNVKNNDYRRNSLKQLLKQSASPMSQSTLYQLTAEFLVQELKSSFVRISFFDSDHRFLNSQALSTTEQYDFMTPKDATMMLMLMPHHQKVLQARETIEVNNNLKENKSSLDEQRQLFGAELSQYFIVPIYHESLIKGVVSVGYVDSDTEVTKQDLRLVEDTATILELNFKIEKRSRVANKSKVKEEIVPLDVSNDDVYEETSNDYSRLNNIFEKELIGN